MNSSSSIQLMGVTPDDLRMRVDQNGMVHLTIGAGAEPATVTVNVVGRTVIEHLDTLQAFADRIADLAHEIRDELVTA